MLIKNANAASASTDAVDVARETQPGFVEAACFKGNKAYA